MIKLEELIEQKKADLELMKKMIEDLKSIHQPVGDELQKRVQNLEEEIEMLEK